jgi:cystathionine beta-lyase
MKYDFDTEISRENTSCYKYDLREKIFDQKDVIPMWVADMDFPTPPFIIEAIKERLKHEILGYTYIPDSFYEAIIGWNSRRHNWQIKKEWISFAPGVVPALNMLVMAFTQPADAIVIQPPVYFPFFSAVQNHGRKLVINPLRYENGSYHIDFVNLLQVLDKRVKMLIVCNPHNPTGNVWKEEDLLQLAEICMKRNILIVSDEIHCDIVYPGNTHTPVATLSDDIAHHTITCMAASKTFNIAGLSTSYLIIPDGKLKKKYDTILDNVHVGSGNIFGFTALEAAYNQGDEWLNQLLAYLKGNIDMLLEFFINNIPCIKPLKPEATYMVWLDCHAMNMNSKELQQFMIKKAKLGLSNGILFGENGDGFQRMNIATPKRILMKALEQLHHAIKTHNII